MVFTYVSNVVQKMDGIDLEYEQYNLVFNQPVGTSRGILKEKPSWFLKLLCDDQMGFGECSVIPGLSKDFVNPSSYEKKIHELKILLIKYLFSDFQFLDDEVLLPEKIERHLSELPSIRFGLEMALFSLKNRTKTGYFKNEFYNGLKKIPINGLVWMDSITIMKKSVAKLIDNGFKVIKIKIGALDFNEEIELLNGLRKDYSVDQIELRVDANGAFNHKNVRYYLTKLSELNLHSIEQPIKSGMHLEMKRLCEESIVPIALDEELIGVHGKSSMEKLLSTISPQFIVIKPSLHGGLKGAKDWIELAEKLRINWWITSALESSMGLDAIAQFTSQMKTIIPQGLGTGSIYSNNLASPLYVEGGFLCRMKH